MGIIFIIVGALLIYFGITYKMAGRVKTINDLGKESPDKLLNAGCRVYLKFVMIVIGAAFILMGLIVMLF